MTDRPAGTRPRGAPSPQVQVLMSMFAAAVLMTAIAVLAVFLAGEQTPRLRLAGPTWQWASSTAGAAGASPLEVPDRGSYTVVFAADGTYEVVADCNSVSGTYTVVPAGRAGGGINGLTLVPGAGTLAACGPGSLSDAVLDQLASVTHYSISGTRLTLTLTTPGSMTFEAAPPA